MNELIQEISKQMKSKEYARMSTCDSDCYGWSSEKHWMMTKLVQRNALPFDVTRSERHGVTEWHIYQKEN